jgi:hypothetical protein
MRVLPTPGKPSQQGPVALALGEKRKELEEHPADDRGSKSMAIPLRWRKQFINEMQNRSHTERHQRRYFQASGQDVFERIGGFA